MSASERRPVMIDPRGHRFGAGVSAALLTAAWWTDSRWLVAIVCASLGVSAVFGLRYSIYGQAWRRLPWAAGWPPDALEPEYAPRFAQTIGSVALASALVLFGLGATPIAWVPVIAVVLLQALLAATGYCVGCRLYFLNWWIPSVVTGLWQSRPPNG